ncbi:THUMP-like domain-containing protein [Olivibacter sitiensis]|uniref:THUMP-like domain-containing protein n=1 Tax=Olivibacter sitiensis TaxID=376470 RepID=UPI0012FA1B0F|nr:class I SAM-dependent methyltransferase [Olivibacter sitiensis]
MNKILLHENVQDYLRSHLYSSSAEMALTKSPFEGITASELASQLDGMQRARKKLPLWYRNKCIYYAPQLASEQASSALTAKFKSSLIGQGDRLIDLTGGFGVDSYYFSLKAKEVFHCEIQEELSAIAAHNFQCLGASNIQVIAQDGISFLSAQKDDDFTVAYIDPSRRVKSQKVFLLTDCEPNIVANQSLLFQKCERILLKAAPLLDITLAMKELSYVRDIYIVSTGNETKELLFLMERDFEQSPHYHAVALHEENAPQIFTFLHEEEQNALPEYSSPLAYLYEPDSALLKAGCFNLIATKYELHKLHPHTHLYTSPVPIAQFIGRQFRISDVMPYGLFKRKYKNIQANVSCRNFPLKAEILRQKHKIKDGGDLYLFFCTGPDKQLLTLFCEKTHANRSTPPNLPESHHGDFLQ